MENTFVVMPSFFKVISLFCLEYTVEDRNLKFGAVTDRLRSSSEG